MIGRTLFRVDRTPVVIFREAVVDNMSLSFFSDTRCSKARLGTLAWRLKSY
jgi:hypothetical protein